MSTTEIMKQKLDIAKRAGKLSVDLAELHRAKQIIEKKKINNDTLHVLLGTHDTIDNYQWDKLGPSLHDLVIGWIDVQIAQREAEVNELIKILT